MNNEIFYANRLESVKKNLIGKYIHPSRVGFEVQHYRSVEKPLSNLEFRINQKNTIPYKKYRVKSVNHLCNKQYNILLDEKDYLDCELKHTYPKYDIFGDKLYQRFILLDDIGEVFTPTSETSEYLIKNLPISKGEMSESILAYYAIKGKLPSLSWNHESSSFDGESNGCRIIAYWQEIWIERFIKSKQTFPDADTHYKINGQKIHKVDFCNFSKDLFENLQNKKEADFGYFNTLLLTAFQGSKKSKKRLLEFFNFDIDFYFWLL